MTTAKAPARKAAPRKAARPKPAVPTNGNGAADGYESLPTEIRAPQEHVVDNKAESTSHPIYGYKALYTYRPKDGSEPIVFPHISTCQPTALFFYDNRHLDEMHQAFAWMDLCGIPDSIGRRLFLLPDEEQGLLLREWFGGLNLTPVKGVAPPGES